MPKEKTGIELAKEEAERKAAAEGNSPNEANSPLKDKKKNGKKVGFASQSNTGFAASKFGGTETVKMRNRAILSDEHEQTQKFTSEMSKTFTKTKQLEKE
jgi:hypothetical protein